MQTTMTGHPLVFAYVSAEAQPRTTERALDFAATLSARAALDIFVAALPSASRMLELMIKNELHIAWLSPIPFVELSVRRRVVPLVANYRDGHDYQSALITTRTRRVAKLHELAGLDVAWVDPLSASGFVVPRIQFSLLGIDPRSAFRRQRFYGSRSCCARRCIRRR